MVVVVGGTGLGRGNDTKVSADYMDVMSSKTRRRERKEERGRPVCAKKYTRN